MRIENSLLNQVNGKFLFESKLFTGVAYELEDGNSWPKKSCRIASQKSIVGGVVVAVVEGDENSPQIALGFDCAKPDTCTLFSFDEHKILCSEEVFVDGNEQQTTFWHLNGVLKSRYTDYEDRIEWDDEGKIEEFEQGQAQLRLMDGSVRSLWLKEGFDEEVLLRHPLLAHRNLGLTGAGVVDSVLARFSGLSDVTWLKLDKTNLTGNALLAFADAPLESLAMKGHSQIADEDLRAFLKSKPDCKWVDLRGPR